MKKLMILAAAVLVSACSSNFQKNNLAELSGWLPHKDSLKAAIVRAENLAKDTGYLKSLSISAFYDLERIAKKPEGEGMIKTINFASADSFVPLV